MVVKSSIRQFAALLAVGRRAPRCVAGIGLIWCGAVTLCADPPPVQKNSNRQPQTTVNVRRALQELTRSALQTIQPSIVRIETIGGAQPVRRLRDGRVVRQQFRQADGPTTGLIWSADGHIITSSFNFVRDPSVITVTLHDGRRLLATLLARDHPGRLTLLKVDARDLTVPDFVPEESLRPGQWAIAAGYGYGTQTPAVSIGIISALCRMSGLAVQTDAKLSPANYGGPLFDIEGRVIGVCVPMGMGEGEMAGLEWYDSGISFAISAARIQDHLPALKEGRDVHRGLMGVLLQAVEEDGSGMRVAGPPRGPARLAGLAEGDLITHIDGVEVAMLVELRRQLYRKAAGQSIRVSYSREGESQTVELTLVRAEELPPPSTQPASAPATRPAAESPPQSQPTPRQTP